jgi:hypothetical protein
MEKPAFRRIGHLARLLGELVELAGIEPATS